MQTMKILVPLDGSSIGDSVLVVLFPLLRSREVEATLLHVADLPEIREGVADRLEVYRESLQKDGVRAKVVIVPGNPAEEILRKTATGDFDLVAMTTHGRTGMDRVLMGSIAEEVVRSSSVPVLLCRSPIRMGEWEHIVVALDGTPGSEEILGDVARIARTMGSTVHLLQVGLGLLRMDGYRGVALHTPPPNPTDYLEGIASQLTLQGIHAIPERREGIAAVEIASFAEQLDAGLICMTTEGRPEELPGLDRSVAAEVIRTAPCPIYVRRMSGSVGIRGRERQASANP